MKKLTIAFLALLISLYLFSQSNKSISIIPVPVSMQVANGNFTLIKKSIIAWSGNDEDVKRVADLLSAKLSIATGFTNKTEAMSKVFAEAHNISLAIITDASLGNEGYILKVTTNTVSLRANKAAGLFYGTQTLLQLLPKEIESNKTINNIAWTIPCVSITDYPRFEWRAMMLDVSRHFFTKAEVKTFIDNMARYKFNVFHIHLTDDQGWRIEIKAYPNLTKIGAWRPQREGAWGRAKAPTPDEPKIYGGFYTQEDIKEIVQYAKERFVRVLPEIDIPGHSMAAVAAYHELSCTPGTYHVNAGEEFQQWDSNGNRALIDNTLCPANENVYEFLDKVFTEVAQLFPFEYIHMGGDETAKNFWEKSEAVKALVKREGLKNMNEVQSYFVKRVEKIIQSKGKKLMGWDEILEGGLAPQAAVMSWRGMKGGIEAAKQGHHAVIAPWDYSYVDLMQGDAFVEPAEVGTLMLNVAYQFDPVPAGVDSEYILGGEGCLWTEHTTNMRAAGYLLWPRTWAVAESVWSPKEKKNWPDFVNRIEKHFERFDIAGINYSRSMYNPVFRASINEKDRLIVTLETEVPGLVVHYSFDETNPDEFYPVYEKPLIVPNDAVHLKVITYRDGKKVGMQINMPVDELLKRAKNKKS
jgi:hexosaminidase